MDSGRCVWISDRVGSAGVCGVVCVVWVSVGGSSSSSSSSLLMWKPETKLPGSQLRSRRNRTSGGRSSVPACVSSRNFGSESSVLDQLRARSLDDHCRERRRGCLRPTNSTRGLVRCPPARRLPLRASGKASGKRAVRRERGSRHVGGGGEGGDEAGDEAQVVAVSALRRRSRVRGAAHVPEFGAAAQARRSRCERRWRRRNRTSSSPS